jgi:hypothetical protein
MVQCGISTIHVHEFMAIEEEDSRNIEDRFGTIQSGVDVVKNLLLAAGRWLKENPDKDVMDNFTKEVLEELVMCVHTSSAIEMVV